MVVEGFIYEIPLTILQTFAVFYQKMALF